jgi:hypothetical protein
MNLEESEEKIEKIEEKRIEDFDCSSGGKFYHINL